MHSGVFSACECVHRCVMILKCVYRCVSSLNVYKGTGALNTVTQKGHSNTHQQGALKLTLSLSHQNAVQSKCTIIHLDGLKTKESACSIPDRKLRNSGQRKAEPAYAASTWSHRPSRAPGTQTHTEYVSNLEL